MTKYYEKTLRGPRKVTKSSTNDTSVTATLSVEPPQEGLIGQRTSILFTEKNLLLIYNMLLLNRNVAWQCLFKEIDKFNL